ncbi:MAG: hypothetical protein QOG68_255, partial [Solirubrobacteraceae bacterium]|nr:hypothetical protein [Solirubrobacteraceae bacterium]
MARLVAALAALALPATAAAAISAPASVRVSTVVKNVPFATNLTFDPAGGMWITSSLGSPVPSDGVWYASRGSRTAKHVATGMHLALGLLWHAGVLYVANAASPSEGQVTAL